MKKSEIRQQKILDYMREIITVKGFPPTVRDICTALNIKSTSTVHADIKALEDRGLIRKDPNKPRALVLIENDKPVMPGQNSRQIAGEVDDVSTVTVPVIGRVAAGQPILSEQNIEDTMPIPSRFVGTGNNFILTVHGDSMINAGINDGDYILVNDDKNARNGDIVVAMLQGEYESEATVKRFYREDGYFRLQPENDDMDPILVDEVEIIGKVRGVFRYFS